MLYLLGMLRESYLLCLPRLKKDQSVVGDISPQKCRWHWYKSLHPIGQRKGFGVDVDNTLSNVVFVVPKVECNADGVSISANQVEPICTNSKGGTEYECGTSDTEAHATIRTWWVEFFTYKDYLDSRQQINWSTNPARNLSALAFGNFLAITSNTAIAASPATSRQACNNVGMVGNTFTAGNGVTYTGRTETSSCTLPSSLGGCTITYKMEQRWKCIPETTRGCTTTDIFGLVGSTAATGNNLAGSSASGGAFCSCCGQWCRSQR